MTKAQAGLRIAAGGPDDGPALAALFDRAGVACFCRYWHFDGASNAWLDRVANAADENRREFCADLAGKSDRTLGVAAWKDGEAIGWLKLAPVAAVPKMYARKPYRHLTCFAGERDGVFAIGCVLVDPRHRRAAIPDALVGGAIRLARELGGRAIEAFPRRGQELRDEERWMGSFSTFRRAGFQIVHDFSPYPVLRLTL